MTDDRDQAGVAARGADLGDPRLGRARGRTLVNEALQRLISIRGGP